MSRFPVNPERRPAVVTGASSGIGQATALVLAAWCIATAAAAHYHPADTGQMIHFMKNVCMAGGFLQVVAYGAGRLSVDRR